MEIAFERNVRVLAPKELVWAEMDSVQAVLSKSPQLIDYTVLGERSARVRSKLTWGPLKYQVEGVLTVRQTVPNQLLEYAIDLPELGATYVANVRITPAGAHDSSLDYTANLEMNHRLASKLRGLFAEVIEEHIHGLVGRVKNRAEQRRLADERLLT